MGKEGLKVALQIQFMMGKEGLKVALQIQFTTFL
jgi:hypothetical protein